MRALGWIAAAALLAGCGGSAGVSPAPPQSTAATRPAAYRVSDFHYHIMHPRHPGARGRERALRYPDDLTDYGGPVMTSEASFDIYVNCPAKDESCWGAPEQFERALTGSAFAGLLRQYTKSSPRSLTFAGSAAVSYPVHPGTALYENDLFSILHGVVAARKKTGYANLYHIFLPKGTDTCFDFTRQCYSPDYAPTNDFCAYHATVRFSDVGLVVYSVEPYQAVGFCKTDASAGATELTNSTISTLAHETFESITDPGPPLAWYNTVGGEIGDECQYFVSPVVLHGIRYNAQPMYSNAYHACATGP